jgi:hypothetical protein
MQRVKLIALLWKRFVTFSVISGLIFLGTFPLPAVRAADLPAFQDMAGHPGEAEVQDLVAKGLLDPMANPNFQPDALFLRGDFLALLARAVGTTPIVPTQPAYPDLPPSASGFAAIEGLLATALNASQFMTGIASPGSLAPSSPLTVAQGLALLVRARGWETSVSLPSVSPFADVPPDYWAYREILAAKAYGLIFNDSVYPGTSLSRWLGAVYLDRALAGEAQKSIYVSLAQYDWSLYMVEGAFIVRTLPVLTGQAGMETPAGTYSVLVKVPVTTMVGADYEVPNVRWCLFFIGRVYAIHGNYWKPDEFFGQNPSVNGSHGCVGLIQPLEGGEGKPLPAGRDDAKIVYDWAEVGTPIVITTDLIRNHFQ